jgi:hypothetical protein
MGVQQFKTSLRSLVLDWVKSVSARSALKQTATCIGLSIPAELQSRYARSDVRPKY